jgi:hypothetical protein
VPAASTVAIASGAKFRLSRRLGRYGDWTPKPAYSAPYKTKNREKGVLKKATMRH